MQTESTISSYSLVSYEWSVKWIEPLKVTGNGRISGTNKSELKLLEVLMVVPIIGSKQASAITVNRIISNRGFPCIIGYRYKIKNSKLI